MDSVSALTYIGGNTIFLPRLIAYSQRTVAVMHGEEYTSEGSGSASTRCMQHCCGQQLSLCHEKKWSDKKLNPIIFQSAGTFESWCVLPANWPTSCWDMHASWRTDPMALSTLYIVTIFKWEATPTPCWVLLRSFWHRCSSNKQSLVVPVCHAQVTCVVPNTPRDADGDISDPPEGSSAWSYPHTQRHCQM